MNMYPRQASLLSLPAEVRQIILEELLHCTEPLLDKPWVEKFRMTQPELERLLSAYDDTQPECYDATVTFSHNSTFKLYPQVLRVCHQLYYEGLPLLYNDKVVEVSYLHALTYKSHHQTYCLGANSIQEALQRWPTLHKIQNWRYTIYLGPGTGGDPTKLSMKRRDADFRALSTLDLDSFIITYTVTAEGEARTKYAQTPHPKDYPGFHDNVMVAFTLPQWKDVQLRGNLPRYIRKLLKTYDLDKLKQSKNDWPPLMLNLLQMFARELDGCTQCRLGLAAVADFRESPFALYEDIVRVKQVDCVYETSRRVILGCYVLLHQALSGCFGCGFVNPRDSHTKLKALFDQVQATEARGPWRCAIVRPGLGALE